MPRLSNRKVHYWLSIAAALPILLITVTGLLLHVKKDFAWIQPAERRGSGTEPALSMEGILEACRTVPEARVREWRDIQRIDIRPGRGLVKVTTSAHIEIQIDAVTGEVLQSAYRRSDLIEALHDGSFFHPLVKRGIFLPAGLALLALLFTGVWLFLGPIRARRRTKNRNTV
jgi:uncharacterized iron-regulated membrane protein